MCRDELGHTLSNEEFSGAIFITAGREFVMTND